MTQDTGQEQPEKTGWRDLGAAVFFFLIGAAAFLIALDYPKGTMRRVGPGMFPAIISVGLMLIGLGLGLQVLMKKQILGRLQLRKDNGLMRTLVFVFAGLGSFALLAERAGLFISVVVMALVVSLADPKQGWKQAFVLAFALAALCSLIFVVGIGIPIRLWP